MSMHSFDVDLAILLGVNEAIITHNLTFWVMKNKANNKHFYENRYWTYNSVKAFGALFPYWSCDKIRGILRKLTKKGIILAGNFNKTKYDQTKWFSLSDEYIYLLETRAKPNASKIWCSDQMELAQIPNGIGADPKPIPDSKPDNKPDSNKRNIKENASAKASQAALPSGDKKTTTKKLSAKEKRSERTKGLVKTYSDQLLKKYNFPVVKSDSLNKNLCVILETTSSEAEAEGLIKFYVLSDNAFFARNCHSIGILVRYISDVLMKFRASGGKQKKEYKKLDLTLGVGGW